MNLSEIRLTGSLFPNTPPLCTPAAWEGSVIQGLHPTPTILQDPNASSSPDFPALLLCCVEAGQTSWESSALWRSGSGSSFLLFGLQRKCLQGNPSSVPPGSCWKFLFPVFLRSVSLVFICRSHTTFCFPPQDLSVATDSHDFLSSFVSRTTFPNLHTDYKLDSLQLPSLLLFDSLTTFNLHAIEASFAYFLKSPYISLPKLSDFQMPSTLFPIDIDPRSFSDLKHSLHGTCFWPLSAYFPTDSQAGDV